MYNTILSLLTLMFLTMNIIINEESIVVTICEVWYCIYGSCFVNFNVFFIMRVIKFLNLNKYIKIKRTLLSNCRIQLQNNLLFSKKIKFIRVIRRVLKYDYDFFFDTSSIIVFAFQILWFTTLLPSIIAI